jgi:glycosyltransferase involved in cell wall biosynthesis
VSPDASICGVIAAYNARETIADVVRGVRRHLGTVIVADDGGTDGTGEAARQAGADVVRLATNRGKGQALRVLFAEARARGFSAVIAIDADGQHDADDIPSLLQAHRDQPEAVITGSRMGDPDRIPRRRRNSMLVARFFVSLAANQFIEDTQCGFRLYPLATMASIALRKERYVTETEILVKVGDSGGRVRSLPIKALYPPGQPTHFRSIRDVAGISSYVISYLMVKWGIEAVRPGAINTYRGPGTGRDVFCVSPRIDLLFESLAVIACLPLSALYSLCHVGGCCMSIPAVKSLALSGLPVGAMLRSILLLPVLLAVAIIDLAAGRLSLDLDWTSRFVHRYYAMRWRPS